MRVFPRALATFRDLVNERGQQLRRLPFDELERLALPPTAPTGEHLTVESRDATIVTTVERRGDGRLRVLVRGSMAPRLLPLGRHLAMDGFYKHPDGTVSPMFEREFHEFD